MSNRRERRANQFAKNNNLQLKQIHPLTDNQVLMLSAKENVIAHGVAGTGKTLLALYMAFKQLELGEQSQVTIIRSVVPTRDMGFLPGNDKEKSAVYETPYVDNTAKLYDRGDAYSILKQKGAINFMTTSFVRGTTMDNTVFIVDECQNMSYHELDSVITRIGENCRVFFCGDWRQADLKGNGIIDFYSILKGLDEFKFVEFGLDDVVRSDLVRNYLIAKTKYFDESNSK